MLNECAVINSGGRFGEISELYVTPEYRAKGVGARWIEAAAAFGRDRGWPNLEVGAPRVPPGSEPSSSTSTANSRKWAPASTSTSSASRTHGLVPSLALPLIHG